MRLAQLSHTARPVARRAGRLAALAVAVTAGVAGSARAGDSFVNWESAHVHPLEVTPDGGRLLSVNTADNRLEVWTIAGTGGLVHERSIPVGLDPISVRARTATEAWVVNKISDSVSIVDLDAGNVVTTILTDDEPGDVVFAGGRAFISQGTTNDLRVVPAPYADVPAPMFVPLEGEDPRGLATDGTNVYAAFFTANNRTSVIHHSVVTNPANNPYAGDPNPVPNDGDSFSPPLNPALFDDLDMNGQQDHPMPRLSLIVKMDGSGAWRDDNGADWSAAVPYTLHGHGMAVVDATTLAVSYVSDLMTNNTAIDVDPATGAVAVLGTHAFNHVRFEPNVRGRFLSVGEAIVPPGGGAPALVAVNPHNSAFFPPVHSTDGVLGLPPVTPPEPAVKAQSLGDPRGVAWSPDGSYHLITGRGSNTVVRSDAAGARLDQVSVGDGPTGVQIHAALHRAYVLNKFEGSISIINLATFAEIERVEHFDPTPEAIRTGRPHLYDTHRGSMLGQTSCGGCHIDGATDLLSWDLGDPSGGIVDFTQTCILNAPGCDAIDWHPLKGPMSTQTLAGTVGTEPLHWRGDRDDLAAFNPAFDVLMGVEQLTPQEMDEFQAFVATLTPPPDPNRLVDDALPKTGPNGGDPTRGAFLFSTPSMFASTLERMDGHALVLSPEEQALLGPRDAGGSGQEGVALGLGCFICHSFPAGTNSQALSPTLSDTLSSLQAPIKVAQLRDLYRKDGFDPARPGALNRGFGFLHDGSFHTMRQFLQTFFGLTPTDRLDLEAFLLSFPTDTHAGVGAQVTVTGPADAEAIARRDQLVAVAESGDVQLVAKGVLDGVARGFLYTIGGTIVTDRAAESTTAAALDAQAGPGTEITWTIVPAGTGARIGIDRDEDGVGDRDEIDQCYDPTDPDSFPGDGDCREDLALDDLNVGFADLSTLLNAWGTTSPLADLDCNGFVGFADLNAMLSSWGPCP